MSVRSARPRHVGLEVRGARRAGARVRREVARRALRSERTGGLGTEEKRTIALGVVAGAVTVAAAAAEVGRVWRRGPTPLPSEADDLLQAAEEAVSDAVGAAVAGYQNVSVRENSLFALLSSFVVTFVSARGISYLLRGRRRFGPFGDIVIGRRHIHHFVPGIVLAFLAGVAAILNREEAATPPLALAFGCGMGLTLDESALLLELEDVYWSPEGLLGVQIALSVTALMGTLALAHRFTRRGEQIIHRDERR